jgi:hypothetical protein
MKIRHTPMGDSTACRRRIRDGGTRLRNVLGAIACLLLLTPSRAAADAAQCSRAIATAAAIFAQATLTAWQRCEDKVARGAFAGPCPGPKTAEKLAQIHTKLNDGIRHKCGGSDHVCGAGGDDDPLATIGWGIDQCPNIIGGAQCNNSIGNCADVAECLDCVEGTLTGDAVTLGFGALPPAPPATAIGKCQREVRKQWASFLGHRTRALQHCEDRILSGRIAGPCPDAQTTAVLAMLERRLERSLCRKCGGADELCGGGDDLTPAAIGFAADCPDVTVPAGATCGGAITTLTELVACLECVGQYDSECLTRLAAPAAASYPAECRSPNGTCSLPIPVPASGGLVNVDTTIGANNFSSMCGGSDAREIILRWTPDVSGIATVNTCLSTTFATVLYMRQTDCAAGSNLTCSAEDQFCAPGSTISFNVDAGETYFLFVDGAGMDEGQTTVTVIPPTE